MFVPTFLDRLRVLAVCLACGLQLVTIAFTQITGWGLDVTERSAEADHLLVPAGFTFAIWGVIYLLALVFTVWQALPINHGNPVAQSVGWYAVIAYAANGIWQIWVPLNGLDWTSLALLWLGLLASLRLLAVLRKQERFGLAGQVFVSLPFGLLAGWLTAAGFVGIGSSQIFQPLSLLWFDFDPNNEAIAVALGAAAIAFAAVMTSWLGSFAQASATAWGYYGVHAALVDGSEPLTLAYLALAGIAVLIVVQLSNLFRFRAML